MSIFNVFILLACLRDPTIYGKLKGGSHPRHLCYILSPLFYLLCTCSLLYMRMLMGIGTHNRGHSVVISTMYVYERGS